MALTERKWWSDYVRPQLHRPAEKVIAQKVQDMFKKGAPDVDMCARGQVMKLELKFRDAWPTDRTKEWQLDLSPEQIAWLREWHYAGGRCAVMTGLESGEARLFTWTTVERFLSGAITLDGLLGMGMRFWWRSEVSRPMDVASLTTLPRLLAEGQVPR